MRFPEIPQFAAGVVTAATMACATPHASQVQAQPEKPHQTEVVQKPQGSLSVNKAIAILRVAFEARWKFGLVLEYRITGTIPPADPCKAQRKIELELGIPLGCKVFPYDESPSPGLRMPEITGSSCVVMREFARVSSDPKKLADEAHELEARAPHLHGNDLWVFARDGMLEDLSDLHERLLAIKCKGGTESEQVSP